MKNRRGNQNVKKGSDSFRWYFDEQFPGPFADISYDDLGPVVILPDLSGEEESLFLPDLKAGEEVM